MVDLDSFSKEPIPLGWVRARRTYLGGRMLEELHGYAHPRDSNCPEEWIASVKEASNPGMEVIAHEALSTAILPDYGEILLKELIRQSPAKFLGESHTEQYGEDLAMLVKLIDSAERLTIQVHPDKEFAKRVFNSKFGKAEAWYIIGSRRVDGEEPYILIGFKPGVTRERWKSLFESQDIPAMMDCLHKMQPVPGQVYMIEGGVPHAIGPGCFLIEIQEPTDYTLRTEIKTPAGEHIPELLIHQGAGYENMLDCFHYESFTTEEAKERFLGKPVVIKTQAGGTELELIGSRTAGLFSMNEVSVSGQFACDNSGGFSLMIVLSGEGVLDWGGGSLALNKTSRMFLPAGLDTFTLRNTNTAAKPLRVIRCFPPSYTNPKH